MIYYEIEAKTQNKILPSDKAQKEAYAESVQNTLEYYNGKLTGKSKVYVSIIYKNAVTLAGCLEGFDMDLMAETVSVFLKEIELEATGISVKEITFFRFTELLATASRNDFVEDDDDELSRIGVDDMRRFEGPDRLTESICDVIEDEETARSVSRTIKCFPELPDEVDRILSAPNEDGLKIHPVHYVLMTDDKEQREKARNLLVGTLFLANRLSSRRVCLFGQNLVEFGGRYDSIVNSVFKSQEGATVILQPQMGTHFAGFLDSNDYQLRVLCSGLRKNHKRTLSIFEIGSSDDKLLDEIRTKLPNIRFVVLREKAMTMDTAKDYLSGLAAEDGVESVSDLVSTLPSGDGKLFPTELKSMYDRWLSRHVCEEIYPQYRDIELNEDTLEAKPEGDAYDKLMDMVGLTEAKNTLRNALDFHKAKNRYSEFGLKLKTPSRHMVFTGNPGSAKTTVARLFAQILKDNGILKEGRFVEAGRYNIVDKYLGGTAPRVHKLFEQANGGVLFIDEAYSLVDGERGLYGDEAINTIVQEMENHRSDVIVIFAGYPDKMKAFLDSNPGLTSRIAFHVRFDDYDTDELFRILQLFAIEQKMTLAPDVEERVRGFFDQVRECPDFGNGRFVRNLFEQAQMRQSTRLMMVKSGDLTREDITTLVADDFVLSEAYAASPRRQMGFHV